MGNTDYKFNPGSQEDWVSRFVRLQIKELHNEELTQPEKDFLAGVELAGRIFPTGLEEELLEYGVGKAWEAPGLLRVAAASLSKQDSIYGLVQEAIQAQESVLRIELESKLVQILKIYASEMVVEPCYLNDYTVIVERAKSDPQVVGKYGGIFISVDDLKRINLEYNPAEKVIRFFEEPRR